METLPILWRRLIKGGETCGRCGGTGVELQRALQKLAVELGPFGIEPILTTQDIDEATFRADASQSNRIWIAGIPMEDWLGAVVGSSRCCAVCGESECRTLQVGSQAFETIPEALIVEAALRAATQMIAARKGGTELDRSQ